MCCPIPVPAFRLAQDALPAQIIPSDIDIENGKWYLTPLNTVMLVPASGVYLRPLSTSGRGFRFLCSILILVFNPAFVRSLPELQDLKQRLRDESGGRFSAVFMTGSGSTMVGVGSHDVPTFLEEPAYGDVFVAQARLIARDADAWYQSSGGL